MELVQTGQSWYEGGTDMKFYYVLYKLAFPGRWRTKLHINIFWYDGTSCFSEKILYYNYNYSMVYICYRGLGELFIFSGFCLRTIVPDDVSYRF